jgi:hypothetical protein
LGSALHSWLLGQGDPSEEKAAQMTGEMSRGEMIRRLDELSKQVHEQLDHGPLSADERHA